MTSNVKSVNNPNLESGQVLLVVVMILAVVLTIVLTITLKSLTSSRTTNIQQEASKSLAVAESAVDQALRTNTNLTFDVLNNFPQVTGIIGQANIGTASSGDIFITDQVERDNQYTFYFSDFDPVTNTFGTTTWNGTVSLYFNSVNPTVTCGGTDRPPALEVILVKNSTNTLERKLIEPCPSTSSPHISYNSGDANVIQTEVVPLGTLVESSLVGRESVQYGLKTQDSVAILINDVKVMVVRVLFNPTKLAISAVSGGNLPAQGRVVNSEAKSASGVNKKVQVFQSYPQLPSEFFVTSL